MTNKEIAASINLTGKLMDLHEKNKFKIRSYQNAYNSLKKLEESLDTISDDELSQVPGVGKSMVLKIRQLLETGTLKELEELKVVTPEGVIELLGIKGIGPSKVRTVWRDLDVASPGELLYACQENRLIELKGFGSKTQEKLISQLTYYLNSKGKFLLSNVYDICTELLLSLQHNFPDAKFSFIGDIALKNPIVENIDLLSTIELGALLGQIDADNDNNLLLYKDIPVNVIYTDISGFGRQKLLGSMEDEFLENMELSETITNDKVLFEELGTTFIPTERRINARAIDQFRNKTVNLISDDDIKGVVHCHTTYSDGLHSVEEMALAALTKGYEYIVITDHSKTAVYANGLSEERVLMQWREIEELNSQQPGIKIFKSIESDILNNGTLDYPDEILKGFDMIIGSIHSNLNMDKEKATHRLITAIENKYMHMLGHPTGRLLLSREGYPIDHKRVIDACAHNNVCIEINANPHRLDIDYKWLEYCLQKEVLISINPDAHSKDQIEFIRWGVNCARKGGLTVENVLNSRPLDQFQNWINNL